MRNHTYNSNLLKGTGAISETISLLSIYDKDTTKKSLIDYVLSTNFLSTNTEKRAKDIVENVFYNRYMQHNHLVPCWLKQTREKGLMVKQLSQLLYVYTLRENAILYDYVIKVLNPVKASGVDYIPKSKADDFIKELNENGTLEWSAKSQVRMGQHMRGTLVDFNVIDLNGNILPFEAYDFTVLYLMHELHFEGLSDMSIWEYEDWGLFNMDKYDVLQRIMNLSLKGGYIAQSSGDLLTISWKFNSMEEMIDATL